MKRIALVLPVLLVAACGGGSEGLSKSDYVSKAEAICKKANADIEALPEPTPPSDPSGLTAFIQAGVSYAEGIVRVADKATTDLKDLDAPEVDQDELDMKFLDPLETQVEELRDYSAELKKAADANDLAKLQQLSQDAPDATKADLTWMKGYGFKECVDAADTDKE